MINSLGNPPEAILDALVVGIGRVYALRVHGAFRRFSISLCHPKIQVQEVNEMEFFSRAIRGTRKPKFEMKIIEKTDKREGQTSILMLFLGFSLSDLGEAVVKAIVVGIGSIDTVGVHLALASLHP